jgi:hypothetical protein
VKKLHLKFSFLLCETTFLTSLRLSQKPNPVVIARRNDEAIAIHAGIASFLAMTTGFGFWDSLSEVKKVFSRSRKENFS